MTDEQQAALAVKDARIAELESGWDAETVKRQVADFNKLCDEIRRLRDALAAREAELAEAKQTENHWWKEVLATRELLKQAEAELATLRGALERVIENPHGCRFCDAGGVLRRPDRRHDDDCPYLAASAALATPPSRTPEDGR
jgi:uncharacterized protein YukE